MRSINIKLFAVGAVAVLLCLSFSYVYMGEDIEGDVIIIHTNDTHGYYDENIGFAGVAGLKEEYESRGATVFLMDAGDAFQGTAATALSHGETTIDVMNSVGYDLMCPGNHEFDYTLDTYLGYTEELEFPTICSNLTWLDGTSVFDEYAIIERDDIRLGVFGILTPDAVTSVMAGYMDDVVVTDPIEAATETVNTLEGSDVDYIVALMHVGLDPSSTITSDEICANVDGIDVCIDGHSHTVMEGGKVVDGTIELIPSDTVIASTGCYINHIGVITLSEEGITAELVDTASLDMDVSKVVDSIYAEQDEFLSQIIGHTDIDLSGERVQSRLIETDVGDLAADSIRAATGTDISVVNGGAIRQDIVAGEITMRDIYNSYPFENFVQVKTVKGSDIYGMMEIAVGWLPGANGSFLQVSGMMVTYDSSAEAGMRILEIVLADGSPLDPNESYTVGSINFVMSTSDFPMLSSLPVDMTLDELALDVMIDYISSLGNINEDSFDRGRLVDISVSSS